MRGCLEQAELWESMLNEVIGPIPRGRHHATGVGPGLYKEEK